MPEIEYLLLNKPYIANINGKKYIAKIKDKNYQPKISEIETLALADVAIVDKDICYYEEYESSYKTWEPIIPVGPPLEEEPEIPPTPEEPETPTEITLYLYNSRDNNIITGGWVPHGEQDSYAFSKDQGTYLEIYGMKTGTAYPEVPTGSYTSLRTANLIDFTDYKTMTIHFISVQDAWDGNGNVGWGLNSSASNTGGGNKLSTGTDKTLTFDISSITQAYLNFYAINHANSAGSTPHIKIDQIYIEK